MIAIRTREKLSEKSGRPLSGRATFVHSTLLVPPYRLLVGSYAYFKIEERVKQFEKVTQAHPNKVPVILERAPSAEVPDIDKNKYLLPRDFTVANFLDVIRKRTNLTREQALFVYVDGVVPASNAMFGAIYEMHKDKDGFLYVVYTGESSFGH